METKYNFKFAMVAYGSTPLAQYSLVDGNYKENCARILSNVNPQTPDAFAEDGDNIFVSHTEPDNVTFLCLCNKTVVPAYRRSFLEQLQKKWILRYGNGAAGFAQNSKDTDFGVIDIRNLLLIFNKERNEKLGQLRQNIEEVNAKMGDNLLKANKRGEKLEDIAQKSEKIKNDADLFRIESTNLRRSLCWQHYRWYVYISLVILVVIFLIVVMACGGFTFKKCKKQKKD